MNLTDGDFLNVLHCFITNFNTNFISILKRSVT
jgi:hypothetical protein